MIRGGTGGKTPARHGLKFEKRTSLASALSKVSGYVIKNNEVFFRRVRVASLYPKHDIYTRLLTPNKINYKTLISKKLVPDDAILVPKINTLFIVEIKSQEVSGSVDEKLQTCDFKLKQYRKIIKPLGQNVKYVYILNDWFKQGSYKDVLAYVRSVGCNYFFNELPFEYLGLPVP